MSFHRAEDIIQKKAGSGDYAVRQEVFSMDIQKIISDLVSKLTDNKELIAKFTADPLAAVKDLLGIDLNPSQLAEVVKGVTSRIDDLSGDAAKEAGGLLDKVKGLFGGK